MAELGSPFWWIVVIGILWVLMRKTKRGNLAFWRAVHEHPVIAIMWMAFDEESWEFGRTRPGSDYVGPFRLVNPSTGMTQAFWGYGPTYERSQDELVRIVSSITEGQELALAARFSSDMVALALIGEQAHHAWRAMVAGNFEECLSRLLRELGLDRAKNPSPTSSRRDSVDQDLTHGPDSHGDGERESPPGRFKVVVSEDHIELWRRLEKSGGVRTAVHLHLMELGMEPIGASEAIRDFGRVVDRRYGESQNELHAFESVVAAASAALRPLGVRADADGSV